ncbi:hypothetical protein BGZ76_003663, partial [Entomortierella beljakovae]
MSAPLFVVFEKRLSKKPSLPSPSMRPQSILVKDYAFPSTSSTASQPSGLFARRGSNSSDISSGSDNEDSESRSTSSSSSLNE